MAVGDIKVVKENASGGYDEVLLSSVYNAADVLTKLKTVDGSTSGLDADLLDGAEGALYARLAGPTFTGVPAAPTAAVDTNSAQLATTAFVIAQAYLKANANAVSASKLATQRSISADGDAGAATFDGSANVTIPMSLGKKKNFSLQAPHLCTGGGTITVSASWYVMWSQRFIVIGSGRDATVAVDGFFNIECPTTGTITGVMGAANKTATAAGIPLAGWETLYYILPYGSASTSVAANFRVAAYATAFDVPDNWIKICTYNSDGAYVEFINGISLRNNTSINTALYDVLFSDIANKPTTLAGYGITDAAKSSIAVSQTAHGFSVGTAIGISGSTWVKSKADSKANANTIAVVFSVIDANTFTYVKSGIVPGVYTAGADYFLSTSTAGGLTVLADPEVWLTGQVRQYIGTGTKGGDGLDVEIDIGDEITFNVLEDRYVSGISFNEGNRVLVLTRTAGLSSLSVAIPYPSTDIAFEARDVVKGTAQTYVLDMQASWPYQIQSIVCESNGTLSGVSVKINSTAVGGLSSLGVGTKTETAASSANSVAINDVVTINTTTAYSGNPTFLRVKLKIKRT